MKRLWMSDFMLRVHFCDAQLKVAIIAVLTIFMSMLSFTAIAQEEKLEDDDDITLEEIVVTGTRIRGGVPVGSTVFDIDREAISLSSDSISVDRIIRELPQIFSLGITENTRSATEGGSSSNITYSNGINIHGIGPYATLVLLDSHRVVTNTRTVNPAIIPTLGLDRIEIVSDGASAVYGSDAVAGVVNLIPRRNLDGIEASLQYGIGDNYNENNIGFAVGKKLENGQFMFAFEHAFRDRINADDRSFYTYDLRSKGGSDYRITRGSPGTIVVGETTYAIPEGGVTQATADQLVPGTVNLEAPIAGNDIIPEQKYISMNSTFNYDITNNIEFYADGFYHKRDYSRYPGDTGYDLTVPNTNAFFVQPPGTVVDSYIIRLNMKDDLHRAAVTGYEENWEITPGFRFKLPHYFELEALFTYGKADNESYELDNLDTNGPNNSLSLALASSDPSTAFDPYGLHRTSPATVSEIMDQIFFAPTLNTFKGYQANITGPLFKLPAGSVNIAAGYEGQEDSLSQADIRGPVGTQANWRYFNRRIDSTYLELLFPLVGSANALPGISSLQATAAWRYDKYSDIDTSTTNPKFGLNYSPIESLSFRGSWGTSFRAPQPLEINGNTNLIFQMYFDNPDGGPPLEGWQWAGANPDLKPEEATTWSIGADFTPTENTKVDLSFFSVEYENQIYKNLFSSGILIYEDEYPEGVILHGADAGNYVAMIMEEYGAIPAGALPGGDPHNVTLYVDGRNLNLGVSITKGLDFLISHNIDTASAGSFLFNLGGTYITQYKVARTAKGEKLDKLNQIFNPLRLKVRGSVLWRYRDLETQLTIRYVNGYDNTITTPTQSVDSYIPVDVIVRFYGDNVNWLGSFGRGLSVGLGARNVFDTDPPFVNISGGGIDVTAADPTGRVITMTLRKSF